MSDALSILVDGISWFVHNFDSAVIGLAAFIVLVVLVNAYQPWLLSLPVKIGIVVVTAAWGAGLVYWWLLETEQASQQPMP